MAWCLVKHRDNFTFIFQEWENGNLGGAWAKENLGEAIKRTETNQTGETEVF